jgi:stage II sporulation protein GA (sporulation sigma-E factor processing peptidase)
MELIIAHSLQKSKSFFKFFQKTFFCRSPAKKFPSRGRFRPISSAPRSIIAKTLRRSQPTGGFAMSADPQPLYLDLLFLVNFSMDLFCFLLTARVLHRPVRCARAALGALAGGLYAAAALFFPAGAPTLLLHAAVGLAVNLLVFWDRPADWRAALECGVVFLALSFLTGGLLTATGNLIHQMEVPLPAATVERVRLPVWLFALLAAASAAVTLLYSRFLTRTADRAELEITLRGRTVRLPAVTDTGNRLCDPITGRPVAAVRLTAVESLLSADERTALSELLDHPAAPVELPPSLSCRLRLLTAATAAGTRLLPALRPDALRIVTERGAVASDALLALTDLPEGTEALLPRV